MKALYSDRPHISGQVWGKERPIAALLVRAVFAAVLLTALAGFLTGCASDKAGGREEDVGVTGAENGTNVDNAEENTIEDIQTFSATNFVMDTVLQETIYGKTDYTQELAERLAEIETGQLSWREEDSEVARINTLCEEGKSVVMSDDFYNWTTVSLGLAENSGGAFDPTIGNLTRLWNIEGENPTVPAQTEIDEALTHIGYDSINIEETDKSITMEKGCTLDLGAVGKGIGCDVVREYLEGREDVLGAVVAVGGSILAYGEKPDGTDWNVAIQNPEKAEGEYMGVLSLTGTVCVSTSGDYEKYFEQDGERYHHILDPSDGYPSDSGLSSVTVVCRDEGAWKEYAGLLSDGLSTACFVLGKEKGMKLLEQYGMDGIFIDRENNVTVTDGVADSFEILDEEYQIR